MDSSDKDNKQIYSKSVARAMYMGQVKATPKRAIRWGRRTRISTSEKASATN